VPDQISLSLVAGDTGRWRSFTISVDEEDYAQKWSTIKRHSCVTLDFLGDYRVFIPLSGDYNDMKYYGRALLPAALTSDDNLYEIIVCVVFGEVYYISRKTDIPST
jgi:hypothetical protein